MTFGVCAHKYIYTEGRHSLEMLALPFMEIFFVTLCNHSVHDECWVSAKPRQPTVAMVNCWERCFWQYGPELNRSSHTFFSCTSCISLTRHFSWQTFLSNTNGLDISLCIQYKHKVNAVSQCQSWRTQHSWQASPVREQRHLLINFFFSSIYRPIS